MRRWELVIAADALLLAAFVVAVAVLIVSHVTGG
jgi:hypothetical protein